MDYTVWLCLLLALQAIGLLIWGLVEIRRPTPADQMRKHFGGV